MEVTAEDLAFVLNEEESKPDQSETEHIKQLGSLLEHFYCSFYYSQGRNFEVLSVLFGLRGVALGKNDDLNIVAQQTCQAIKIEQENQMSLAFQ